MTEKGCSEQGLGGGAETWRSVGFPAGRRQDLNIFACEPKAVRGLRYHNEVHANDIAPKISG